MIMPGGSYDFEMVTILALTSPTVQAMTEIFREHCLTEFHLAHLASMSSATP